eukprot:SAG11_NODE_5175_length_1640_cov_1.582090_2_plen_101_part_00
MVGNGGWRGGGVPKVECKLVGARDSDAPRDLEPVVSGVPSRGDVRPVRELARERFPEARELNPGAADADGELRSAPSVSGVKPWLKLWSRTLPYRSRGTT